MKDKTISYLNYLYLSLVMLWDPLRMTIFHMDSKGRVLFVLTFLVLFMNLSSTLFKKIASSKPAVIWLIWVVYAFANMSMHGSHIDVMQGPVFFFVNNLFTPYLCMCVACKEMIVNKTGFMRVMLVTFLTYTVIGFFFMNIVRSDTVQDEGFTLGNALALTTSFVIFFALLLYSEKKMSVVLTYGLIAFAVAIVVATATRKAFGAGVIILLFYVLAKVELSPKNIILAIVAFAVAYFGMDYMMDNTLMGERFLAAGEQAERVYDGDNILLKFVGDRAIHYVLGWDLFINNPITGIGLYNFMFVTGYPERIHSEYIVNLAENGIIGSLLFLWFYVFIIKKLRKMCKNNIWKERAYICLGVVAAILFIGFTAWLYEHPRNFICIGVAMGYILSYTMGNRIIIQGINKREL